MYDQFGHAAFDQSAGGGYQGSGFGNGFQGFKSGPGGYQEYHFTGNADDIFGDMFKDIFHGNGSKSTGGFGSQGFSQKEASMTMGPDLAGSEDLVATDQQALIRKVRI